MRGVEIMLMGLYSALAKNGTRDTDESASSFDGYDDDDDDDGLHVVDWREPPENPMPSEIRVTAWQNMPYSGLKEIAKGKWVGTGYAFEILKIIQSKLHFNYTVVPPETPVLGNKTVGVMKQLWNKEVDIAVSFIPITGVFRSMSSFGEVVDEIEISFLMKRLRESAVGSGLLAPFNTTVWVCILIALIITGPVIYVVVYFRTKVSDNRGEGFPLITCIWFTYGALLKQGSTITPVTDSTRSLFATWWIFITILTSFYTANLTAFLTLSEFTLPFTSINDIYKQRQKWATFSDHTLENTLNETDVKELKLLEEMMRNKIGVYRQSHNGEDMTTDFKDVTDYVNSREKPLFISDKHFMKDLIFHDYRKSAASGVEESKRCTLVMLPQSLYVKEQAFAYQLNSTIIEHINKQLRTLIETGIIQHMKKEKLPGVTYCPLNLKSTERRLANSDLRLTYYCVFTGFTLATIVFIGELIFRIAELRKSCNCDCCFGRLCCRSKVKTTELPTYNHDPRPNFLKQNDFMIKHPHNEKMVQKHIINGRDYWVIREHDGDRRLIPIRSPSALLFHP